jgi:hypothetical protein
MTGLVRFNLVVLVGIAALVGAALPASASPQGDFFVVDTQFWDAPSPIIDAGGAFSGCSSVVDLGGIGEQISPRRLIFIGDKLVQCDDGDVTIHFNATLTGSGKRTSGHWFVTDSTLPGVTDGFGTVRGDNTACQVAAGSDGCIRDVFAGDTQ